MFLTPAHGETALIPTSGSSTFVKAGIEGSNITGSLKSYSVMSGAVQSVTLTQEPTQKSYQVGDTLNLTGIRGLIRFSDGSADSS